MRAALFDLDRTLVRKETATLYVRYQREIGEVGLRDLLRVSYWVAKYTLGILDAQDVAARAVGTLAGKPEHEMIERCDEWFVRWVEPHIAEEGRRAVERHRREGDLIAIVTGATPYVARPLARKLGIEHVVASTLEVDEAGRFTGRPEQPLCIGEGKVTRAERLAAAQGFRLEEAVFYSDSCTDLPLLLRVGEPVVVNPDPRLAREARRRGWRVERW
ncbi:MAG TPA: HAD family hydrolase [Usitatibacter sp.]|nr:HAD family hydrolase [Usitatibacter sp.]